MKIIVQKFGGTSVSTSERRKKVIDKIITCKQKGFSPVIVVSAMGRKGEPYATDTLLSLVNEEFKKDNKKAVDLLISCGEIISAVVLSNELNALGYAALPLTGGQAGMITNSEFSNAEVIRVDTKKVEELVQSSIIPVITGFQGITEDGYFTTLGRGGSDVSAAIIGGALKALEVEIYTDVDGIMTADPRIVNNASLIKQISYNEVFQFADQGAKVIHPRAVEAAMKYNIKLSVKNTLNDCDGTLITNVIDFNLSKIATGITHMSNRVQIQILSKENEGNSNYDNILDLLAHNKISIDLINVFPHEQIFTIDENEKERTYELLEKFSLKFNKRENCSKIAIIGSGMRGVPGVMARILKTLRNENIKILQTADSNMTIWCLVESINTEKAINVLHKEFRL